MSASLTTQFDSALFDDQRYGFDVDAQRYVNAQVGTQYLERADPSRFIRVTT